MAMRTAKSQVENVRMGPLALFTLVVVLCLSVLAVLSVSTANATLALSERRASATRQLYLDEQAAQTFVATLETALVDGMDATAARTAAEQAAREAVAPQLVSDEQLTVTSDYQNRVFDASFDCGNGRQLDISLHQEEDGSLSVQKWRFTAVVNEEPTMGNLFGSS